MQPKYLITYPYIIIIHTYIFVIHVFSLFSIIFKCRLEFKLLVGEISLCYKVGLSEISPPQSLLPSCTLSLI